jgi:dipeptidyl aminopeptidase/acylaminoacyl peptidase
MISSSLLRGEDKVTGDKLPIGIDFFAKVKSISNLREHDQKVFFILRQADVDKDNYQSDLYQLADNGDALRLTSSGDVSDYFFLGSDIIFSSIRDQEDVASIHQGERLTVFRKLSDGYGESIEWLRLPYRVKAIEVIDQDRIFFTAVYRSGDVAQADAHPSLKSKGGVSGYRVFDELPFWSNGQGDISGSRTHLYVYDRGGVQDLSAADDNVSAIKLSPDKSQLVYTQQSYRSKAPVSNQLLTMDTRTLGKREWSYSGKAIYAQPHFIDEHNLFITINLSEEHDRQEFPAFYRLELRTGRFTEVYNGYTYAIGNTVGSDIRGGARAVVTFDGADMRYISTIVDQASLISLDADGTATVLSPDHTSIDEYIPLGEGFLAIAMVEQQGQEIYYINEREALPLSHINTELFDKHRLAKPIEINFVNRDGLRLNGYVLPPANHIRGKKYPTILDIHGGPRTTYGTVFFHEMQYWSERGYAVIFTNPTGSNGRGQAFADLRGLFGTADYDDLMYFLDAAIDQVDFIDRTRLGVTGGSYGGLMTNWIIGHTDRFKAAVSQRGISSWLTFANTSDIGYSFARSYTGTNAWENSALLWQQSPLKYADKVTTPTLFIHSEQDYRCWLVEGIQMYYALQYFEVPARMVIFKQENHELSRSGKPTNRIRRLNEITLWFDNHL